MEVGGVLGNHTPPPPLCHPQLSWWRRRNRMTFFTVIYIKSFSSHHDNRRGVECFTSPRVAPIPLSGWKQPFLTFNSRRQMSHKKTQTMISFRYMSKSRLSLWYVCAHFFISKPNRGLSGELEHPLSLLPASVSHTNIHEHNEIFQSKESISDLKRIRKRKSNENLRDTKTKK